MRWHIPGQSGRIWGLWRGGAEQRVDGQSELESKWAFDLYSLPILTRDTLAASAPVRASQRGEHAIHSRQPRNTCRSRGEPPPPVRQDRTMGRRERKARQRASEATGGVEVGKHRCVRVHPPYILHGRDSRGPAGSWMPSPRQHCRQGHAGRGSLKHGETLQREALCLHATGKPVLQKGRTSVGDPRPHASKYRSAGTFLGEHPWATWLSDRMGDNCGATGTIDLRRWQRGRRKEGNIQVADARMRARGHGHAMGCRRL